MGYDTKLRSAGMDLEQWRAVLWVSQVVGVMMQ